MSGSTNMSRISVTGRPGEKICVIDRFSIDKVHREDKIKRHGAAAMTALCLMYRSAGTSLLKVVNPTSAGRRFYCRSGFFADHAGDLIVSLQTF